MRQDITQALWRDAAAPARRRFLEDYTLWGGVPKELPHLWFVRLFLVDGREGSTQHGVSSLVNRQLGRRMDGR